MNFTIHEKFKKAKHSIDESLNSLELQNQLLRFGFSAGRIKEGKELLERASKYYQDYKHQSALEYDCNNDLYQKKEVSHQTYVKLLRQIKPALKNQQRFWKELEAAEFNAKGMKGWIQKVQDFYQLLLNDGYYLSRIQLHGLDKSEFQKGLCQIILLHQAYQKQQKMSWETRRTRHKLEQAMHEFDNWNINFKSQMQLALLEFKDTRKLSTSRN
jgi:hypothetical protein